MGNSKIPFLHDGAKRLEAGTRERIRAEVECEYADRLSAAGWFERMSIHRQMRDEIDRRLKQKPKRSPWALFVSRKQ
ncbi:MAG TPA: hypothetical protein VHE81_19290 [Lacipirellulaceae bacterium]|nr:hypothetical protein [Lacipirellulaceae bacterium]